MIDRKKAIELIENLARGLKNNKDEEWIRALHDMLRFYLEAVNEAINPIIPPTVPFLCASLRYMAQTLEADHHAEAMTAELVELLKEKSTKVVIPVGKFDMAMKGGEEE
jgi:hypothetical protein